jgi:hypothetical protein
VSRFLAAIAILVGGFYAALCRDGKLLLPGWVHLPTAQTAAQQHASKIAGHVADECQAMAARWRSGEFKTSDLKTWQATFAGANSLALTSGLSAEFAPLKHTLETKGPDGKWTPNTNVTAEQIAAALDQVAANCGK